MTGPLTTWRDGAAKQAVVDFVSRACGQGQDSVPVEERVAVFDNDGTLWCEKPLPIQADFILRRLAEMAEADPELRERQPWKGAYERDYGWLDRRSPSITQVTTRTCGYSLAVCLRRTPGSASTNSRRRRIHFCARRSIRLWAEAISSVRMHRWSSCWAI